MKSNRIPELDGLRGLAALSVVLFHYTTRYNEYFGHSKALIFNFQYGHYGVLLFFMISGFVIFMTLEKTKSASDFIISRFSRLYPAYWAAIGLTYAAVSIADIPKLKISAKTAAFNLTMLQSFFDVSNVDGVYWTLQVELLFYVIMLLLFKMKALDRIKLIISFWLLLGLVFMFFENLLGIKMSDTVSKLLILRYIPFFAIGMLFYDMRKTKTASVQNYFMILLCVMTVMIYGGFFEGFLALFFCMIFSLFVKGNATFIGNRVFVFLGTISYPLYLLHQKIGYCLIRKMYSLSLNPNLAVFVAVFVSIMLATGITYTIEKPALKLIRSYKKTGPKYLPSEI